MGEQAEAGLKPELFDGSTFHHLEALGITEGWRCWEVGSEGPSVPRWLAGRVGPTGSVLATGLDVTRTREAVGHGVKVRRHDVAADPPPAAPGDGFHLVRARLLLGRLDDPDRERALRAMTDALRPGGRLLLEEADPALQPLACPDEYGPEQVLANRVRRGLRAVLGAEPVYGRTLPRLLRAAGLVDVGAAGYLPLAGPAWADLEAAAVRQARDRLIAAGHVTEEDVGLHLANVTAGRVPDLAAPPMVSAWGTRP